MSNKKMHESPGHIVNLGEWAGNRKALKPSCNSLLLLSEIPGLSCDCENAALFLICPIKEYFQCIQSIFRFVGSYTKPDANLILIRRKTCAREIGVSARYLLCQHKDLCSIHTSRVCMRVCVCAGAYVYVTPAYW